MADLTTLAKVKLQMRISGTDDDTLLEDLIDAVSLRVEREIGRTISATDYKEWYSGNEERVLSLRQWPMIYVNRVAYGADNAFSVTYTGSDITATVQVHETAVRLVSHDSSGSATTNDLTFATYATMSAMVTQINTISGWSATLISDQLIGYLHPMGGRQALNQTVNLTYADVDDVNYRVDHQRGTIAYALNDDLWTDDEAHSPWVGALVKSGRIRPGYQNVLVDYRAGYETVPADINQVARELVQLAYQQGALNGAVQAENLGSYSYQLADRLQLTDRQYAMLAPYMRIAAA